MPSRKRRNTVIDSWLVIRGGNVAAQHQPAMGGTVSPLPGHQTDQAPPPGSPAWNATCTKHPRPRTAIKSALAPRTPGLNPKPYFQALTGPGTPVPDLERGESQQVRSKSMSR